MAQKSTFGDDAAQPSSFGDQPVHTGAGVAAGPSLTEADYNHAHPDQGWVGDAVDFLGNAYTGAKDKLKGMFTPSTQLDPEIAATPKALATPKLWEGMVNPNADPNLMRPVQQFQDNDMAGLGQSVGGMVPTAVMLGAGKASGVAPDFEAPSSSYLTAGARAVANKAINLVPGARVAKLAYKVGKTAYDFHKAGSAAMEAENAASAPATAPTQESAVGMEPPPGSARFSHAHDSVDKHAQDAVNKATNIHDYLVSQGVTSEQFNAMGPDELSKVAKEAKQHGVSRGVPVPKGEYGGNSKAGLVKGTSTHKAIADKLAGQPFPWEPDATGQTVQPATPPTPAPVARLGMGRVPPSHPTTPVTVNGVDPSLLEGIAQGFGKSYAKMSPAERLTVQHLASKMQAQGQAQGMQPPPTVQ